MDDLKGRLPECSEDEIREKAEELAYLGFLSVQTLIGAWRIRPTQQFYQNFDHQLMNWDGGGTRRCGSNCAMMLEHLEAQSPELHELTGWPLRRFNPALSILKNEHPDWCWRDRYHFDYPSLGLLIGAREKTALRMFIKVEGA